MVETVQNTKIVDFMNQSLSKSNRKEKLNVMLQSESLTREPGPVSSSLDEHTYYIDY